MQVDMDLLNDLKNILQQEMESLGYSVKADEDYYSVTLQYYNIPWRKLSSVVRVCLLSDKLQASGLLGQYRDAVDRMIAASQAGQDLTPFMSSRINKPRFNDLLWNDWGITHFHLGNQNSDGTISRTSDLLFVFPTETHLHLIDIRTHESFEEFEFVEILHRNWPQAIAHYKEVLASNVQPKPKTELFQIARNANVKFSLPIEVSDGTVYHPPGGGYMTSGVSIQVVRQAHRRLNILGSLCRQIEENSLSIAQTIEEATGIQLAHLRLSLKHDGQRYMILEEQTNCAIWSGEL